MIIMINNSWDSGKQRLGRGQVFTLVDGAAGPGEVTTEDGLVLVARGLAEDHAAGPVAVKDMLKADIVAELTHRQIVHVASALRGALADLLVAARKEQDA
jgi:hypothetical protein